MRRIEVVSSNETVRAALVVTIADLARTAAVYNDVVVAMNRLGWATTDVVLRSRVCGLARHEALARPTSPRRG